MILGEPFIPSAADAKTAAVSSKSLAALVGRGRSLHVTIPSRGSSKRVELPAGAVHLLVQLLSEMSKGHAVTLMPVETLLTTQQAAEFLGVSRPFVIKELKNGRIPFQKVGTHRRILFKDVVVYKRSQLSAHDKAMNSLVEQSQTLDLGY